jgi:transcriptional regulator with XRE-family HTH domain
MADHLAKNSRENATYVVQHLETGRRVSQTTKQVVVERLGISDETYNRMRRGEQKERPNDQTIMLLAQCTGVTFDDFAALTPQDFKAKYSHIRFADLPTAPTEFTRKLDFRCTTKSPDTHYVCYKKNSGSFYLVVQQTAGSSDKRYNIALLSVTGVHPHGVAFEIFRHVSTDSDYGGDDSRPHFIGYQGLLLNVDEYLHFIAEQVDREELRFLVTTQLSERRIGEKLSGRMLGLQKSGAIYRPMTWNALLIFASRKILDRYRVYQDLGSFTSYDKVPRSMKGVFDPQDFSSAA